MNHPNLEYPFEPLEIIRHKRKIKKELFSVRQNRLQIRIALLSGSTIGDIKAILELFLLNQGIEPIFFEGSYARYYEESVYPNPELKTFRPDIIYIHTTSKNLEIFPAIFDHEIVVNQKINTEIEKIENVCHALKKEYDCVILINNFESLQYRILGNIDSYHLTGRNRFIIQLNDRIINLVENTKSIYLNDINYLAAWFGLENWYQNEHWYLYKYALNIQAIPLLSHNLSRIIGSIYGRNKKALVLDLDNTLWGGVIGDDGLDHIHLGEETPDGRAYVDFQRYLKELTEVGIILTVCSKNNPEIAEQGFYHDASILKKEDFVSFKANWEEKNVNINSIASEVNLNVDSFVFLDDNPFERELVKKQIPEISVPEMNNISNFTRILDQQRYFEVTHLSIDDKIRVRSYKENTIREISKAAFSDYNAYLYSLKMKCTFLPWSEGYISRIIQLINKTNQFNLTTERHTEETILPIIHDNNQIKIAAKLQDKFGDNGLVTILIASVENKTATIDLWVMSCRVFKRDLEIAVFNELVKRCKQIGCNKIIGRFLPTAKNLIVADIYPKLGFALLSQNEKQALYSITIEAIQIDDKPNIQIVYENEG
jgi:FkbH-like protein